METFTIYQACLFKSENVVLSDAFDIDLNFTLLVNLEILDEFKLRHDTTIINEVSKYIGHFDIITWIIQYN